MATVSVRYIVYDVEAAIGFYTRHLGFSVQIHPNEQFAMLNRGDLRLVLSVPGAPAEHGEHVVGVDLHAEPQVRGVEADGGLHIVDDVADADRSHVSTLLR